VTPSRASAGRVLDLSGLATYAYGNRSLMWWGTLGLILIESTVFALGVVTYLYLRERTAEWPPHQQLPSLLYGTVNLIIMILSGIPNQWTKRAAEQEDRRKVQVGLLICLIFAAAFLVIRGFEFGALHTAWNDSAYGSIVFALLLLHTVHLATDFYDSAVLTVLMITGPISGKRFVDVSENAFYWWFVVASWVVIYATVYIVPRLT